MGSRKRLKAKLAGRLAWNEVTGRVKSATRATLPPGRVYPKIAAFAGIR